MLRTILFIIASMGLNTLSSQSVTGSWYGKADVLITGNNSNYLTELVIKQKGNEVEGIFAYYFKDSYQSFFVRGNYNPKTRQLNIKNLPMLFYAGETKNGIECPMNFEGKLMVSTLKSSLNGSFYTESKYKYTCPEIRVNFLKDASENNPDSALKAAASGKKFWKPQVDDFIVSASPAQSNDTLGPTLLSENTASVSAVEAKGITQVVIPQEESAHLVEKFNARKNTYNRDVMVASDSILVTFYDNGDVDGDSISVFINKKPVLINQKLSSRALNVYVALDSLVDDNELSMFADNLGKYPPNTALMVISDGLYKHELYLSSSLTQNASVRLKRTKEAEERRRRKMIK